MRHNNIGNYLGPYIGASAASDSRNRGWREVIGFGNGLLMKVWYSSRFGLGVFRLTHTRKAGLGLFRVEALLLESRALRFWGPGTRGSRPNWG